MGRRPKHRPVTIKDPEIQSILGVVFLVIAVLLALSLFVQSMLLDLIRQNLGVGVVVFALAFLAVGLRLLGTENKFNSTRVIVSILLFGVTFLAWIHLFVPGDNALVAAEAGQYGGVIGYTLSRWIYDRISRIGGLILLTPFIVIFLGSSLSISPAQLVKGIIDGVGYLIVGVKWFVTNIAKAFNWMVGKKDEPDLKVKVTYDNRNDKDKENQKIKMVSDLSSRDKEPEQSTAPEPQKEAPKTPEEELKYRMASGNSGGETVAGAGAGASNSKEGSSMGAPINLYPDWKLPPISLLDKPDAVKKQPQNMAKNADIIEETFSDFGIRVRVVGKSQGPSVTQYMLAIPAGTKVSKIEALTKDLTLSLAAPTAIRIVAPIPGTPYIGIEVANPTPQWVSLRELLESDEVKSSSMRIPIVIGKDVAGKAVIKDLTKMPHFLIAGATGSGKSVLVNGVIISLLFHFSPDQLRLIMVDPKMVELYGYNNIPHLLTEVITDVSEVLNSLKWILAEMERRYKLFKEAGARSIDVYNEKMGYTALPYLVLIIDEMADLMLRHGVEVENAIVRLAQMARATGIHLILATQRPSVDVVTGLIKANIPARAAMAVTSIVDSRVILDQQGAETLLGRGDMLLKLPDSVKPTRIQGVFLRDNEIEKVLSFVKEQTKELHYNEEIIEDKEGKITTTGYSSDDDLFTDAVRVIVNAQRGSASLLQTKLSIGYARASRLIDEMEKANVVGPVDGNKPRKVLVTDADGFLRQFKAPSGGQAPQHTYQSPAIAPSAMPVSEPEFQPGEQQAPKKKYKDPFDESDSVVDSLPDN